MPDMLVKLYNLKDETRLFSDLKEQGIVIKKVLSTDRTKVLDFVRENFNSNAIIGWTNAAIGFYEKTVQATVIEDSTPGIYARMIEIE